MGVVSVARAASLRGLRRRLFRLVFQLSCKAVSSLASYNWLRPQDFVRMSTQFMLEPVANFNFIIKVNISNALPLFMYFKTLNQVWAHHKRFRGFQPLGVLQPARSVARLHHFTPVSVSSWDAWKDGRFNTYTLTHLAADLASLTAGSTLQCLDTCQSKCEKQGFCFSILVENTLIICNIHWYTSMSQGIICGVL